MHSLEACESVVEKIVVHLLVSCLSLGDKLGLDLVPVVVRSALKLAQLSSSDLKMILVFHP